MKTENKIPAKRGRKRKIITPIAEIPDAPASSVKKKRKYFDKPNDDVTEFIKTVKAKKPKRAIKVKYKPDTEPAEPKQSVVIGSVLAPAVDSDASGLKTPRIASIGSRNASESDDERNFANSIEPDADEIESVDELISNNIDSYDNKKPFSKSNRYTITKRVEMLIKDLCKGLPTFELVEKYTKLWNISDRQYFLYQLKAQKKLDKHAEFVASTELGKSIKRLESMLNTAIEFGDLKNGLAIQKELNELLGLKKPTVIKNENVTETVVRFVETDADIIVPETDE